MAHNINESPFVVWGRDPPRSQRFADAMTFIHSDEGFFHNFKLEPFVSTVDFASIDDGTFVDVGGSYGTVSIPLAGKFPGMRFIVQDLPTVVEKGRSQLPEGVKDRVTFMVHDFFEPQPVEEADIYFFRWVLHDWSDLYAVRILRALIPALKTGSRVLINEVVMPPHGAVSKYRERQVRLVKSHDPKQLV